MGVFIYLQVLDFLTTIAFLIYGVSELNPIVQWAMQESPSAISGLLLMKLAAVGLALACMLNSKHRLLRRVNIFFGGLVVHNVLALIMSAPGLR